MFCKNDIIENNLSHAYKKPKPKYEIINNELVLTGVPVPKRDSWENDRHEEKTHRSWRQSMAKFVFVSHFLHDIYYRCKLLRYRFSKNYDFKANWPSTLKKSHPE